MKKLLLSLIVFSVLLSTVSAYNPFKWQLCSAANMSEGLCDDYWDAFRESMGINISDPESVDVDLSSYWNKTEIEQKILEFNNTIDFNIEPASVNESEIRRVIIKCFEDIEKCFEDFDEDELPATQQDAEKIAEEMIDLNENLDTNKNSSSDDTITIIIIVAIIAVAGMVGFIWFQKNASNKPIQSTPEPVTNMQKMPTILPRQRKNDYRQLDNYKPKADEDPLDSIKLSDLDRLMDKYGLTKKPSTVKKPVRKKKIVEEEEDVEEDWDYPEED